MSSNWLFELSEEEIKGFLSQWVAAVGSQNSPDKDKAIQYGPFIWAATMRLTDISSQRSTRYMGRLTIVAIIVPSAISILQILFR